MGVLLAGLALGKNDAWETEWADLVAEFDSSGPATWDSAAHPNVFVTTEGMGYSGLMSGLSTPGVAIIDADTKEVVVSPHYELEGASEYFEPHGPGVSPDGSWIYLPTVASSFWRTRSVKEASTSPTPNDDNRMVGSLPNGELQGRSYLGFVTPDGKYMLVSTRPPRGVTAHGFVAVVSTENWKLVRTIDVLDSDPIWVTFTADGTQAFVPGGHDSLVARLSIEGDPGNWHVDSVSNSAALGPYGAHLNWDDDQLYVVSKGEPTHNRGITLGQINTTIMRPPPYVSWAPGPVAAHYTACMRGDHGTVHPDPDLSELWMST